MQNFTQVNLSNEYLVNMRSILGKGSTGSVFQGRDLRTNQMVAVKVIELSTIDNEVTQYLLKMQKIALMILSNSYVLKGLKILQDQKYCFMVTQYCNGGTLKKYIKDSCYLSEQKSLKIIKQLLQGYKNLVEKKVVHRDLKPANIMIHNGSPKIIDFGYCQIEGYKKPRLEYNVGSPSYMAPQSFQFNIYNQKTQIWSIGVILYQCLTGKTLDEGRKMTEIYQLIKTHGIKYPDYFSKLSKQVIGWCLKINPSKRPTCSELLSKYFSKTKTNEGLKKQNFLEEQSSKTQKSISTLTSYPSKIFQTLNNHDKQILYPQNKWKEQQINSQPKQKVFGTLANMYHHQSMNNKYIQNRQRSVFSSYQPTKVNDITPYQLQQLYRHRKNSVKQRDGNTNLMNNMGQLLKQQNKSIMQKSMIPLYNPEIGMNRKLNNENKFWQKSENLKRNSTPNQVITNFHKIILSPTFVSHPHLNRNLGQNNLNICTERQRITSYRV